jgi:hypothetical protein
MTAITKRRVIAVLAIAQPDLGFLLQGKLARPKARALMTAVTQRLMPGQTAGTPPMVTSFKFHRARLGFIHFGEITHGSKKVHLSMPHPQLAVKSDLPHFCFITLTFIPPLSAHAC